MTNVRVANLARQQISPWRLSLAIADGAFAAVATLIGPTLYYNGTVPPDLWDALQGTVLLTAGIVVIANIFFGLYRQVWKYAGVETALAIVLSVSIATILAAVIGKYAFAPFPIIAWVVVWLLLVLEVGATRFFWRVVRAALQRITANGHSDVATKRVLLYGAGDLGCAVVQMSERGCCPQYDIVGFVDDAPSKRRAFLRGIRVQGTGADLKRLIGDLDVHEVIITIDRLPREKLGSIVATCREAGVTTKIMPSLLEMMGMETPFPRDINTEDLLGRETSVASTTLRRDYIKGKTVLVTGAGGSIGSDLCRQICRYGPAKLILLGRGENRIHWVYLRLQHYWDNIEIVPIVCNVTNAQHVDAILAQHRPHVIFHAAAHKHVYLMESVPAEAARNNVIGTRSIALAAERHGVERFIFISTDKAVNPGNIMGATKRTCELLITGRPYNGTVFSCVRFGNVLGSEGSVVQIFERQWQNGEPLTITHPDVTRYFMSIPEACLLVLQAGAIGNHGDTFLLNMGSPVKIRKLAEDFIRLKGGDPSDPGVIATIGLRPGEKLHEALTYDDEGLLPTEDENIMCIQSNGNCHPFPELVHALDELAAAADAQDDEQVSIILNTLTGNHLLCRETDDAST